MSPVPRQTVTWNKAELLSIGDLATYTIGIVLAIEAFAVKNMHLKIYQHHFVKNICIINYLDPAYKSKIYPKIYEHSLRLVMFGCDLVLIDLTHIRQGYFGGTKSMNI